MHTGMFIFIIVASLTMLGLLVGCILPIAVESWIDALRKWKFYRGSD